MNCQICNNEQAFHEHRIISGAYGGKYTKNNVAHICANCHEKVHRGLIIIEGIFMTTAGYQLLWHNKGAASITGMEQTEKVYVR